MSEAPHKALLDWDGTLREPFTILDWYDYLDQNGFGNQSVPASVLHTIHDGYRCKRYSYDAFAEVLVRLYALGIDNLSEPFRIKNAKQYAKGVYDKLYGFTPNLVRYLQKDQGLHVIVVTGSPIEAVKAECVEHDLAVEVRGTRVVGSRRTRQVVTNQATTREKKKEVAKLIGNRRTAVAISFGDSESDAPLMAGRNARVVQSVNSWSPSICLPTNANWGAIKSHLDRLLATTLSNPAS